jgi:magnesium chelatase family protein
VLGVCHSAAPQGVSARLVEVEVDYWNKGTGTSEFIFVGLADTAVREARDRVRTALGNAGYYIKGPSRVLVNLAPADLRKEGTAFDLPVAVALLLATGQVAAPLAEDHLLVGELSLDGRVRPVRGALCIADRAARSGRWKGIVVPAENAGEAALARGLPVFPVETLAEAVRFLSGAVAGVPARAGPTADPPEEPGGPDFAEVRGQENAVRAAVVAAAGGHNLLLVGPPGSGKTMIAERIPSILPPLGPADRIEATKIHSVAGTLRGPCVGKPPFRAPHHTVSPAGLLGGGIRAQPGEITLAHRGVLFLDELPEFDRRALEGLREPLERGEVSVVRVGYRIRFPSRFLLVAAMNPCPCGKFVEGGVPCRCTPFQIARYASRISGPLLDRMDLQVHVPAVPPTALGAKARPGASSGALRAAVVAARARQGDRGGLNGGLSLSDLDRHAPLGAADERFLHRSAAKHGLSARAVVRIRRLALTLADLRGAPAVAHDDIAEALLYRVRKEA